jgi:hypothetical protein
MGKSNGDKENFDDYTKMLSSLNGKYFVDNDYMPSLDSIIGTKRDLNEL